MLDIFFLFLFFFSIFRYMRAEILAGFVNALFLLFVGFFILSEAVEVMNRIVLNIIWKNFFM